jgi:DNA-binding SARP family transcriptional activator
LTDQRVPWPQTGLTHAGRLLGPVDILAHGAPRLVAGRRRRAVLAGLALNTGAVVSADHLIDIGWPEAAGPVNGNALQCQVSQLR